MLLCLGVFPIYADILRTMQTSEDTGVYDKVVNAIFDKEMLSEKNLQHFGRLRLVGDDTSSIQYTDSDTELRDHVSEVTREVFRHHCAKRLEVVPIRLLDDCPQTIRFLFLSNSLLSSFHLILIIIFIVLVLVNYFWLMIEGILLSYWPMEETWLSFVMSCVCLLLIGLLRIRYWLLQLNRRVLPACSFTKLHDNPNGVILGHHAERFCIPCVSLTVVRAFSCSLASSTFVNLVASCCLHGFHFDNHFPH